MTKTSQHSILGVWSSQILIQHSLNKGIVVQLTAYMIFPLILFLSSVHQGQSEVLDMAVFLWRSLICSVWLWQWSSDQVLTVYCVQLKQICSIILTAVLSQHSQQSTECRPNRVIVREFRNFTQRILCFIQILKELSVISKNIINVSDFKLYIYNLIFAVNKSCRYKL